MGAHFSPDGLWIVTASSDHTARVWDAQTGQPLTEPLRHGAKVCSAQFSPDGRQIVTASMDHTARVWDIGLAPSRCPAWLLQLAEALSGSRLSQQGLLERTSLDRAATIAQLRDFLANQPDHGDGVLRGRWLLADRSKRTISPLSSVTVPEYIQNRICEGTAASLDEATQLAAGDTELLRQISEMRGKLEKTSQSTNLPVAARQSAKGD